MCKLKRLIALLGDEPNTQVYPDAQTQNVHVDGRRFTVKEVNNQLEVKRHTNSGICAHNGVGGINVKTFNTPEAAALQIIEKPKARNFYSVMNDS